MFASIERRQYAALVINRTMNGREWGILILLALIWGGSFLFIKVAVTHVAPLSFVWLRVSIAAAALLTFLQLRGRGLPSFKGIVGPLLILALLNNVFPFCCSPGPTRRCRAD